jgi:hypothetical protein
MGGSQSGTNFSDEPLRIRSGGSSPIQFNPTGQWQIQSAHPEAIAQGIQQGVGNLASGVSTAVLSARESQQQSPDYAGAAASAGKSGPVADTSNTPQVEATKKYFRNPSLANFSDMEYPTSFKFNRY